MPPKTSLLLSLILASSLLLSCAQPALTNAAQPADRSADFFEENGAFHFNTEQGTYVLRFFSEDILEVEFFPEDEYPSSGDDLQLSESERKVRDNVLKSSHAVVMEPTPIDVQVSREGDDHIRLNTSGVKVVYDKNESKFSFYHNGRRLLQEHNGFVQNPEDDGYRVGFRITNTEMLMGGGSRALGMDRRGHRLELYNRVARPRQCKRWSNNWKTKG